MSTKPKLIFLLTSISQPRCHKRIKAFIKEGYELEVYGFDRGFYNKNATVAEYDIKNFGFVPSGSGHFKKLLFARKKINAIFKKNKTANVLYYCFSFDLALICKIYNKKYAYEISDLVYGYFKRRNMREFFTRIDRKLIKNSFLTVMTSKGFQDFLYPQNSPENIIIQPNRVDAYFLERDRSLKILNANNIIFSYVGAFRYPNTVFRFAKIVGENFPQHSFHFYGDSHLTQKVKDLVKKYPNVKYFGPFKNPDDLTSIYSKVDVVVACYDIKTLNERIAEPNKLYESFFFEKPIIVSKDTFLEQQVLNKYKCGFSIDATKDNNIINLINALDQESMLREVDTIREIKLNEIIDDESVKILQFIKNNSHNPNLPYSINLT